MATDDPTPPHRRLDPNNRSTCARTPHQSWEAGRVAFRKPEPTTSSRPRVGGETPRAREESTVRSLEARQDEAPSARDVEAAAPASCRPTAAELLSEANGDVLAVRASPPPTFGRSGPSLDWSA